MCASFDRYHRQMLLPGWGEDGQSRLTGATVLVVGVGALGSTSAELLARAGVGRLIVVDRDAVELTNLQRQGLYSEADVGRAKVDAAADRLRAVNSCTEIDAIGADLRGELAVELAGRADVIVDGTDNFETRYVLNDAAVAAGVPLVYGGAVSTRGTVMAVLPGRGPCLRCLADELPVTAETCDTVGVFGPVVQLVAARQAAIALRLLLGGGDPMPLRLESVEAWSGEWRGVDVSGARDPSCACCVRREFGYLDEVAGGRAVSMCGRESVHVSPGERRRMDLDELAGVLGAHGRFESSGGVLRGSFAREYGESGAAIGVMVFGDGRAIVSGTSDTARARSIVSRYIGG